jgi:hypothetical protein
MNEYACVYMLDQLLTLIEDDFTVRWDSKIVPGWFAIAAPSTKPALIKGSNHSQIASNNAFPILILVMRIGPEGDVPSSSPPTEEEAKTAAPSAATPTAASDSNPEDNPLYCKACMLHHHHSICFLLYAGTRASSMIYCLCGIYGMNR